MPLIKLYANLRKVAETNEVRIPGTSVDEIFSEITHQIPALADYLLKDGHIRPHVLITINGNPTVDETTLVTEQDVIAIFPPIAGG
jgi:molybdopterin converting factor small subunit